MNHRGLTLLATAAVVAGCLGETALGHPPAADFTHSPASPQPGQTVTFTPKTTAQPGDEGYVRHERWDLDNDGEFDDGHTSPGGPETVSRNFPVPGDYVVRMESGVTEPDGGFASHGGAIATRIVQVRNPDTPGPKPPGSDLPADLDSDGDGVPNGSDNCPLAINASQENLDGDAFGDACDPDRDNDGVENGPDNCRNVPNPDQVDSDGDRSGDACDQDDDDDTVVDPVDNCVLVKNKDQANDDKDQAGDACDADQDGDGFANSSDVCPTRFGRLSDPAGCPPNVLPTAGFRCSGYDPGAQPPPAESTDEVGVSPRVARLQPAAATPGKGAPKTSCPSLKAVATKIAHVDASLSSDFDGKIVKYEWDFDGNGAYDKTTAEPQVTHIYGAPGTFAVRVRVTDDRNGSRSAATKMTVLPKCEPEVVVGRIVAKTSPCFTVTSQKTSDGGTRYSYTSKQAVSFNGISVVPKPGKTVVVNIKSKSARKNTSVLPTPKDKFEGLLALGGADVYLPFGPAGVNVYSGPVLWGLKQQRIGNFKPSPKLRLNEMVVKPAPPNPKSPDDTRAWVHKTGALKIAFYPQLPSALFPGSPSPTVPEDALVIDTGVTPIGAAQAVPQNFNFGTDPNKKGAFEFRLESAAFGPLKLEDLVVKFDGVDFWEIFAGEEGDGGITLPPPIPYAIRGGVGLRGGNFEYGWGEADNLGLPIGVFVALNRIKFSVAVKPKQVQPSFEECVPFIGKVDWTMASWVDYVAGAGDAIRKLFGAKADEVWKTVDYGRPEFVFCGELGFTAPLSLPVLKLDVGGGFAAYPEPMPDVVRFFGDLSIFGIPLAKSRGAIYSDGYVDMMTQIDAGLEDVVHVEGLFKFRGYFGDKVTTNCGPSKPRACYPKSPVFNAEARVEACLDFVDLCAGAELLASSRAIAGCLNITLLFVDWTPGFAYEWHPKDEVTPYFTGCDVSEYREKIPVRPRRKGGGLRRARLVPGQEQAIELPPGLPGAVVMAIGETAPPRIKLVGPNGETITTPDGDAGIMQKPFMLMKDPKGFRTSIAIGRPAGGTWRAVVEDGSSAVTSIQSAEGLEKPRVTAKVSGQGRTRTLSYETAARPGQVLQFFEEGPTGRKLIGESADARGSVNWEPAPGKAEKRAISVVVLQDEMPRATLDVATYSAPATFRVAKPSGVVARRRGSRLQVSWRKVSGARTYDVQAILSDGRRIVTSTTRPSLRINGFNSRIRATVSVKGVPSHGVAGRTATVRFPTKKRRRR